MIVRKTEKQKRHTNMQQLTTQHCILDELKQEAQMKHFSMLDEVKQEGVDLDNKRLKMEKELNERNEHQII